MLIWDCELRRLGFRRLSGCYWQAEQRFRLPTHAYLSIFTDSKRVAVRRAVELLDVSTFHVTFPCGVDRLHFYYRESAEGFWDPGGHTTFAEIERYPVEASALRERADEIAGEVACAFGGVLLPRRGTDEGMRDEG